jgi:hypothetical protein
MQLPYRHNTEVQDALVKLSEVVTSLTLALLHVPPKNKTESSPKQCIYVFHVTLTIISDYFP